MTDCLIRSEGKYYNGDTCGWDVISPYEAIEKAKNNKDNFIEDIMKASVCSNLFAAYDICYGLNLPNMEIIRIKGDSAYDREARELGTYFFCRRKGIVLDTDKVNEKEQRTME